MNLYRRVILIVFATALLMACSYNQYYDVSKPHHTSTGFRNVEYDDSKGFWDFIKWRLQRLFKEIPDADAYEFNVLTPQHELINRVSPQTTLTWVGHATFLIQFRGLNILTDPQFSDYAAPVSWAGPARAVPAALSIQQLPEIDVVLISHDHYDSLDRQSVMDLAQHNRTRSMIFIVPLGMKTWLASLDLPDLVQIIELDWGQNHSVGQVNFIVEPAQHWGKRSLFDAFERLWGSFVIESGESRLYFAGDTGYSGQFKQLGAKYSGFDLSLLPIGAYEPRWFMSPYHVNPDEAVQMHMDLRSKYSVAMHWGTFILSDERLDEPPVKLSEALHKYSVPLADFEVYQHGETRVLGF